MTSVQPHMRIEDGTPVPCGCMLGYHHTPEGYSLQENNRIGVRINRIGRHLYCVGACKVWGTSTEEFDFRIVRGPNVSENRIRTCLQVVDHANADYTVTLPDGDSILVVCEVLGMERFFNWIRSGQHKQTPPERTQS